MCKENKTTAAITLVIRVLLIAVAASLTPFVCAEDEQNEVVKIFVQLKTPSVAEFGIAHKKATGEMPSADAQRAHAAKIDAEHKAIMSFLTSFGAKHVSNMRVSANGVNCKVAKHHIDDIKQHPAVNSVSIVPVYQSLSTGSVSLLNGAPALPALGLTGKGKTVAIVGTGIYYDLETFGGSTNANDVVADTRAELGLFDQPTVAGNDPDVIEPGSFPTAKFVGGIDLGGGINTFEADPDPFSTTITHETMVAAIVGGGAVQDRILPGIAPDAKMLAIKVYLDGLLAGGTDFIAEGIEYSLDPNQDGSFNDRADVINLSLGIDFGFGLFTDLVVAVENAVALGVVVVAGAGNAGNEPFVLGSPASELSAISVGAHVSPDLVGDRESFFIDVESNGEKKSYRVDTSSFATRSLKAVLADPIDTCDPLVGDGYAGKIVIFKYKNCIGVRGEQSNLASAARAVASVVIGGTSDVTSDFGQAVYAVDSVQGEEIIAAVKADPNTTIVADRNNRRIDTTAADFAVTAFSSRGGVSESGDFFKPDLIAPGLGVTAGGGPSVSGTSFSTPFISGLVAALLEQRPELSPAEMKALIQNSTTPSRMSEDPVSPVFPLSLQGVGRVQADVAVKLTSLAMPGGLSFGILKPSSQKLFELRTLTLKNLSDKRRIFKTSIEVGQSNPGIELRVPQLVHLPPNSTKEISVRMVADPRKLTKDDMGEQLIEADGWIVFEDILNVESNPETLRVGYMAEVEPVSNVSSKVSGDSSITLANPSFVGTQVEVFSKLKIDEETLGYRFRSRPDGKVELTLVTLSDSINRSPRDRNIRLTTPNARNPAITDLIRLDKAGLFLVGAPGALVDGKLSDVFVDYSSRWTKYKIVLLDSKFLNSRVISYNGVPLAVNTQMKLENDVFFIEPGKNLEIKKNSDVSGEYFLLIHRNDVEKEILEI